MKNRKFKGDWKRKSYEEFLLFYSMCSKEDRAFFDAPSEERNPEDYVRLLWIAMAFGFKRMTLQIMANMESTDDWNKFLEESAKDKRKVIGWFDDFVRQIPIPEFKEPAEEVWEKVKKSISKDGVDIRDLFK